MHLTRALLATTACTLILASAVEADPTSDARKAIAALYLKTDAAFSRKDIDGATAYYTADFFTIDEKGKHITLAQERQLMQQFFPLNKDMKSTSTIQKFRVSGKTSIVMVSGRASGTLVNPQTHATKAITASTIDRDTWIKTSQGWRKSRSETVSSALTIDGKPVKQ